jgi:ferredoxin
MEAWVEFNDKWAEVWPNITEVRPEDVPEDATEWHGVEGKMQYFSENPGKGD